MDDLVPLFVSGRDARYSAATTNAAVTSSGTRTVIENPHPSNAGFERPPPELRMNEQVRPSGIMRT
ncbi:MAG TPA: hypothetical protein VHL34_13275 [Rhizomicrobium sp.]|nr:hypothetical protein [Rhizomicrobium sp.]